MQEQLDSPQVSAPGTNGSVTTWITESILSKNVAQNSWGQRGFGDEQWLDLSKAIERGAINQEQVFCG